MTITEFLHKYGHSIEELRDLLLYSIDEPYAEQLIENLIEAATAEAAAQ